MQISDLHNNLFGEEQSKIIKIIEKEKPGIIVLTGNVNNKSNIQNVELLLKNIKNVPILYVTGNHEDYDIKAKGIVMKMLEENNVHILENKYYQYKEITFYGIGDIQAKSKNNYKKPIG